MFELPLSNRSTKVFFWAADFNGCGTLRMQFPAEALRNTRNWDVRVSTTMQEDDLSSAIVIAQRSSRIETVQQLLKMKAQGVKIVYELDDDLLNVEKTNNPLSVEYYGRADVQKNIKLLLSVADLVTVSTPYLAEQVAQYSERVVVLPNFIADRCYKVGTVDQATDSPIVGWAGGDSHKGDLGGLSKALRTLTKAGVPFKAVGWDIGQAAGVQHTHVTGTNDYEAYLGLLDFHVGVVPLIDTPFNRSKSYLKALEYGLRGIPVVAADVEPYREFVDPSFGLLVDPNDYKAWLDAISLLVNDHELRARMGAAGRANAEKYKISKHVKMIEKAYKSLLREQVAA